MLILLINVARCDHLAAIPQSRHQLSALAWRLRFAHQVQEAMIKPAKSELTRMLEESIGRSSSLIQLRRDLGHTYVA
jgi:hypothetical protein